MYLSLKKFNHTNKVIFLTVFVSFLSSCSPVLTYEATKDELRKVTRRLFKDDDCNNRSFIKNDIQDFISSRYLRDSPVRMAVIPYSVPVSFSTQSINMPGLDLKIAAKVKAELHKMEIVPIIELFHRTSWPRKKDEFFAGNHGALSFARQAGYDLILVGHVDAGKKIGEMRAETKIIDVSTGITLYYGSADTDVSGKANYQSESWFYNARRRPDLVMHRPLLDKLSMCIANGIGEEE